MTSYFDVNTETHDGRPNGIHNHVNTRSELKSYDLDLYNLVREVFPCENTFLDRCSAVRGVWFFSVQSKIQHAASGDPSCSRQKLPRLHVFQQFLRIGRIINSINFFNDS